MKTPIVNRKDYTQYIEYFNDMFWFHTDVYNWTAETKKHYIRDLNQLQSLLDAPLYALVDNDKLGKFATKINFSYIKELLGNDGNIYKIYKRSL